MSDKTQLIPGKVHFIPLSQACEMTALYRRQKEAILVSENRGTNILPLCETFNRYEFDEILKNPDCAGLRFYYSMDEDLRLHMIIVGVNMANEDILPDITEDGKTGIIDSGLRCPMSCPPDSPLNS